jgi:hypothetical protein
MNTDLAIDILEIYKAGKIQDRQAVYMELRLKEKHELLDIGVYSQTMDDLHARNCLKETGTANRYILNPGKDCIPKLKSDLAFILKEADKDRKARESKRWQETHYLQAEFFKVSVGKGAALLVGLIIGLLAGLQCNQAKSKPESKIQNSVNTWQYKKETPIIAHLILPTVSYPHLYQKN